MSAPQYIVPESTTEYNFPESKRKKIIDHKGNVVYDSDRDK
jgi:hypothetical protein